MAHLIVADAHRGTNANHPTNYHKIAYNEKK